MRLPTKRTRLPRRPPAALADRRREKEIEAEMITNLRDLGFKVSKTSQQRASKVTVGIPDLYASHARWQIRLWIEVKAGDNRPSLEQQLWHEAERAAGGTVLVAWNWRDVTAELLRLGAPISL